MTLLPTLRASNSQPVNARQFETATPARVAARIVLEGRVQGLGVRPAIVRLAHRENLSGWVRNTLAGVEVHVAGTPASLDLFTHDFRAELPPKAQVDRLVLTAAEPGDEIGFSVVASQESGPLSAAVPTDLTICQACLADTLDMSNRRADYALTSCSNCGPRFSLIHGMPYERADTSLSHFPLCPACQAEYASPADRRFHAQTISCPHCGPRLWATNPEGKQLAFADQAVSAAVRTLRALGIVALKGVGGYQLLVAADDVAAVARLRQRKQRPAQPLAVLVASLAAADSLAALTPRERELLASPAGPIVLALARPKNGLAENVHPGLRSLGLLLPATSLHALLVREFARPLVCTSGNVHGEPLSYDEATAQRELAGVADLWLHHDRPILQPCDDSVVRVISGRAVTVRLARGLAPLRLELSPCRPMMALGGHMKVAAAWSNGKQAVLGPHVGEMKSLGGRARLVEQLSRWQDLYRFAPSAIACDLHPDYFTTQYAEKQTLPVFKVQHHHAHVVAGMIEAGWLNRTVLGVCWDGTGFGPDGTIWGGEFLIADRKSFRRVASLMPFSLPGGETCIQQPWRTALSAVNLAANNSPAQAERLGDPRSRAGDFWPGDVDPKTLERLLALMQNPRRSPQTTSAGRLFDAAAALVLRRSHSQFDGQFPMLLESEAAEYGDHADRDAPLPSAFSLAVSASDSGEIPRLDWRPPLLQLVLAIREGESAHRAAWHFHRALAAGIVEVCRRFANLPVVLCGGVFQNGLLTELVERQLHAEGREIAMPGLIPPGDGGLAAGQLAVASTWQDESSTQRGPVCA